MPESYQLQLERRAERALLRLPRSAYQQIERAIDRLAAEPRPDGTIKLQGPEPLYRLRIGEYRVVYAVFDRERLVKIIDVMRRTSTTYRRF